jgi:spermidine/putrescine-binding protein
VGLGYNPAMVATVLGTDRLDSWDAVFDIWFVVAARPADAPHPENAHAFLNYLMESEVIAKVSSQTGYANGNLAALPFPDARVRDDPAVYPPEEIRLELPPDTAETPACIREASRAWTRIKTGQ